MDCNADITLCEYFFQDKSIDTSVLYHLLEKADNSELVKIHFIKKGFIGNPKRKYDVRFYYYARETKKRNLNV